MLDTIVAGLIVLIAALGVGYVLFRAAAGKGGCGGCQGCSGAGGDDFCSGSGRPDSKGADEPSL